MSYPDPRRRRLDSYMHLTRDPDAITLHHYCAGFAWETWQEYTPKGSPVAVGDQVFRFMDSYDYNKYSDVFKYYILVEASDDYAKTWYEYSRFDCELRQFRVLPIHQKSKTIVYFIGQASSHSETGQVWVSKDLLKTIELVNENTGFAIPEQFDFTAGLDNVFILFLGVEFQLIENTWISHDLGQSWESNAQNGIETYKGIRRLNMITVHRDRMYAQHVKSQVPTLVFSTDRGLTWKPEPCNFAPCLLIADNRGDRLLCFMNSGIYQLVGDSVQWEMLPCQWQTHLECIRLELFPVWSRYNSLLFGNCVILVPVTNRATGYSNQQYLISHPDHGKARKDKTRLAINLARRGIDSALFVAHLAPFLFPY